MDSEILLIGALSFMLVFLSSGNKNRANLKVANICHCTTTGNTSHTNKIFIFKIEGVQMDYSKYITNDGGIPTIIATTFDNTRNLYEENDLPLINLLSQRTFINLKNYNKI